MCSLFSHNWGNLVDGNAHNTHLIFLTKNTEPMFLLTCLLFLYFYLFLVAYSLLPPFMLRICSGYLGCGLHYGRNGSPQNPFSRKGLYPWAACSSVWLFSRNKTRTSIVSSKCFAQAGMASCEPPHILFDRFASHLNLQPTTCFSCRCTISYESLSWATEFLLQAWNPYAKPENRNVCRPVAENQTVKRYLLSNWLLFV